MSLINNLPKIIDSKKDIDSIGYLSNQTSYVSELTILDIDWKNIIQPPSKNSSSQTEKELNIIEKATKSRTRKEIDLVWTVDDDPLALFYKYLERKNKLFPQGTFDEYYNILEQYIYALKYYFNRARPEQIAPFYNIELDIIYTNTHQTPSYPSGHAAYAELAAYIASDKFPEYKQDFFELSRYCGLARILQGVHYPSDNEASIGVVNKLYPLIKEYIDKKQESIKLPLEIATKNPK